MNNIEASANFWASKLPAKPNKVSAMKVADSMKYGDSVEVTHVQARSIRDYMGRTAYCRGSVRRINDELSRVTKIKKEIK